MVRLYLSSYRLGDHPKRLVDLLGDAGPVDVAVVANAMDSAPDDVRQAAVEYETSVLQELGSRPRELDLRTFIDLPADEVASALIPFAAVWARGGNAFMLRYAMARSHADAALISRLRADTLVYGGYSAGGCVLAPSLRGLELCDAPGDVTRIWDDDPIWEGLGILEYAFVPHVDSPGHPETDDCGRVVEHYRTNGTPYRALRDGQVLLVDGEQSTII